jgi:hypothetical protein
MWLRRQDELNEARPTERFSTAIRLLSGRAALERKYAKAREEEPEPDSEPDESAVVDVRALAVPATEVKPAAVKDRPSQASQPKPTRPAPSPRAKVLARRRRTTTLLFLTFTAGAVVAAVGGLAFLWAPGIPAVLLSFYIGHLRRQERRRFEVKLDALRAAEDAQRVRDRHRRSSAETPIPDPAPTVPTTQPATADRRALVEQTDHAEWVDQQRPPTEEAWEVPVPLPTFVTAPVAPRRASERTRTPLFDQHADRDRPRAANE